MTTGAVMMLLSTLTMSRLYDRVRFHTPKNRQLSRYRQTWTRCTISTLWEASLVIVLILVCEIVFPLPVLFACGWFAGTQQCATVQDYCRSLGGVNGACRDFVGGRVQTTTKRMGAAATARRHSVWARCLLYPAASGRRFYRNVCGVCRWARDCPPLRF